MDRLKRYRKTIDKIDRKIVKFLARRLEIVKKIGAYKKIKKLPVFNKQRENDVLSKVKSTAKKHNSDDKFMNEVYKAILEKSRKLEK
jgi:chorismate mutase